MRRLLPLVIFALFIIFAQPVFAQDETPDVPPAATVEQMPVTVVPTLAPTAAPTPPVTPPAAPTTADPIAYLIIVVLAVLVVAAGVYGGYITKFLATLVPPETAASIYQSGVRFGLQLALNRAAQTPSELDNEFFVEMARLRGLKVTKVGGEYVVETPDTLAPTKLD